MLYIFDWDGTLCNSLDRIAESIERSCEVMGLSVLSREENKSVIGLGLREALHALYPDLRDAELTRMIKLYRDNYLFLDMEEPSALYDGAMDVLENLKSSGHQIAVATGKSRHGLDRVLGHLNMESFFDASRCADETRSKPHPLMLEEILSELSAQPEVAVMVGDTDYDLLMARAAGVKAIGVSYGAHNLKRLRASEPQQIIDHLSELL